MAQPNLKTLREDAQSIYQEYGARFAGKPRATRDVDALDGIIDRLGTVVDGARSLRNGGHDPALSSFLEQAIENLQVYQDERDNIAKVQSQGEVVLQGSQLATWANLQFGHYFRHFAGKPRATRDLGLLDELILTLELVESRMQALLKSRQVESVRNDLSTVESNLDMYREERKSIVSARQSGSLDERASYLALVANEQFNAYGFHFGGRPRVSRRPGTLHRIMATLEGVRDQMDELDRQGLDSQQNRDNIGLIGDQIDTYRQELGMIQQARRQTAADEMVGQLGSAANWAMAQYNEQFAGEDRENRNLELLSRICDEMLDIADQMRDLDAEIEREATDKNLSIVLDNLMLYQDEYEQIFDAQR